MSKLECKLPDGSTMTFDGVPAESLEYMPDLPNQATTDLVNSIVAQLEVILSELFLRVTGNPLTIDDVGRIHSVCENEVTTHYIDNVAVMKSSLTHEAPDFTRLASNNWRVNSLLKYKILI